MPPQVASSNLVRVTFIKETDYGVTPPTGSFSTARFTSETLSGSPQTVESKQIRIDRMSSGQIVTGLTVEGSLSVELAKETQLEAFMESAFYNTFSTLTTQSVNLTIDATAKTLTRGAGSFIGEGLKKGDIIRLSAFGNTVNNTEIQITLITATVITFNGPSSMVNETGTGTSYKRLDKLDIGVAKQSFSIEKKFTDLTDKGINYRGMVVGTLDLNVAFGELITGSVGFFGNDQQVGTVAADLITNTRTILPPATSQTLNGSIDMPFLSSGAIGVFGSSDFSIKSIALKLDNNLSPQNIIGKVAPRDYTVGTCKIDVELAAYLDDSSWAVMPKKLSQDPFELGFLVKNTNGLYGFYIPQLQVSFDDPSSPGQNQDVMLSMKGMAKVGASGESALSIFRG